MKIILYSICAILLTSCHLRDEHLHKKIVSHSAQYREVNGYDFYKIINKDEKKLKSIFKTEQLDPSTIFLFNDGKIKGFPGWFDIGYVGQAVTDKRGCTYNEGSIRVFPSDDTWNDVYIFIKN